MEPAQAIDMAAMALHQAPEIRHSGSLAESAVEIEVEAVETGEVVDTCQPPLFVDQLPQPSHDVGVRRQRECVNHLQLNRAAQELRMPRLSEIDRAHHRRVLGKYLDQVLFLKLQEGVANRG